MRSPKSLHNLQHDEGGKYMAEAEEATVLSAFFALHPTTFGSDVGCA
jgi:hypothetical protein